MTANIDIFVAIKLLTVQSKEIDGTSLQKKLTSSIEICLQQTGSQENNFDDLLLFRFNKLPTAFLSVFNCLKRIKNEFKGNFLQHKLPVRIIFYNPTKDISALQDIRTPESSIWETLQNEVLYVTASLKTDWYSLLGDIVLPSHLFEKSDSNLFQVRFFAKAKPKAEQYFPYRDLTVQGKMQSCFYCGMKSHSPAQCPSKLSAPELLGIRDVGYLSISDISDLYKKVFSDLNKYTQIFETGVSYSEIRKDPALLIFITFFDLLKVYQLRFLPNLVFTKSLDWKNFLSTFTCKQDNRNLAIGFDCLRVGQYQQANETFEKEFNNPFGKFFYATVGQAFIALETVSLNDMRSHLNKASFLAKNEKEKVYIALLLARVHTLTNDMKSAGEVLSELFGDVYECVDAKYAQIQLEINRGATEKTLQQLRDIIENYEEYFIMVLLDPLLLPVQDLAEEILTSIFRQKKEEAKKGVLAVRQTCDSFMVWANKEDNELKINLQALEGLEEKVIRNSYFDYLDVVEKCNGLDYGFKQIQKKQLNKITRDVNALTETYNRAKSYWKGYSYKSFFKAYNGQLDAVKIKLTRLCSLVESDKSKALREALDLIKTIRNDFQKLDAIHRKMSLVEMSVKGLLIFGKNLLILEVVFVVLGFCLFMVSSIVEPGTFSEGLIGKLMLISTMIVAPFIAVFVSLVKVINKY